MTLTDFLAIMYPGTPNSPISEITTNISATDTIIPVAHPGFFPPAPNTATLGLAADAETVLYMGRDADTGALTGCIRGFEKYAKAWAADTRIARVYTNYDQQSFIDNITKLFNSTINGTVLTTGTNLNTVTTPGIYAATASVAASLVNSPVNIAFTMVVVNVAGTDQVRQDIVSNDLVKAFSRVGNGATFISWVDQKVVPVTIDGNGMLKINNVAQDGLLTPKIVKADTSAEIARKQSSRIYTMWGTLGTDLSVKHATEIAAAPYSGNVWAWIKARIGAGNFDSINVGDYIPFTADGKNFKAEVAGINTYYNAGDAAIGRHIDFITRDCWPAVHQFNKVNYNNGTTVSPNPFLASDLYAWLNSLKMNVPNAATANPALLEVDYTTSGVWDKLPANLQNVIITKRALAPSRYTAGSLLVDDNSWAWQNMGKIWIPSEIEVFGTNFWATKGWEGGHMQYPIFKNSMSKCLKGAGDGGGRSTWWLQSAYSGYSTYVAHVYTNGHAHYTTASNTGIYAAFGFRIA